MSLRNAPYQKVFILVYFDKEISYDADLDINVLFDMKVKEKMWFIKKETQK